MTSDSSDSSNQVRRILAGDSGAWGALLARHEPRLRRLVEFRLDPRLQGRVDPADVLQEIYLAAYRGLAQYRRRPGVSFFLWLRGIASNKLLELHRHHLDTPMRDARREVSLHHGPLPEATSVALAARLLGHLTAPSEAAVRAEAKLRLQVALDGLDPLEREILALRHFEHLSNAEAAEVLGIKAAAAGKRYLRALERLRATLAQVPGALDW